MTTQCVYIYRDPKTGIPRYVGRGSEKRPYDHLKKSRSSNPQLSNMIRKRIAEGFDVNPEIMIVDSVDDAKELENLLVTMIGRLDQGSGTLFNLTDGGDGGLTPSKETRELIGRKAKEANARPEVRAKWTQSTSVVFASEQYKRRQSAASSEKFRDEEHKQRHSDAVQKSRSTKSSRQKTSSQLVNQWQDPAYRKTMTQKLSKRCTVDGVVIYDSVGALRKALGHGSRGFRSPTFRYVEDDHV